MRTGIGVDVHAFSGDPATTLTLAGLTWPGTPALAGHSDGDAAIHAITDSLLSASGLGDLGSIFGTADPRFRDADSRVFLAHTLQLMAEAGLRAESVAVQVIAQRPRIGPRRLEAQALLTELVGAPVSFTATTTDGLGFIGRDEGIAAIATALVTDR